MHHSTVCTVWFHFNPDNIFTCLTLLVDNLGRITTNRDKRKLETISLKCQDALCVRHNQLLRSYVNTKRLISNTILVFVWLPIWYQSHYSHETFIALCFECNWAMWPKCRSLSVWLCKCAWIDIIICITHECTNVPSLSLAICLTIKPLIVG